MSPSRKQKQTLVSRSLRLATLGEALQKWGTEIFPPPQEASLCHRISVTPCSGAARSLVLVLRLEEGGNGVDVMGAWETGELGGGWWEYVDAGMPEG